MDESQNSLASGMIGHPKSNKKSNMVLGDLRFLGGCPAYPRNLEKQIVLEENAYRMNHHFAGTNPMKATRILKTCKPSKETIVFQPPSVSNANCERLVNFMECKALM